MLTLNDGRSELWQWDTGRKLTVDADCSQIHFSNKVFGRSIDVDVVDGVAIVPDILLQTDKDLTAWAFVGTAENGYTKISKVFRVNKRNKPADYVFTEPDQTTLGEILERIEDLENRPSADISKEDIQNAVNEYLDNNPVSVNEKDPTVPDWAKQPSKPTYTAKEVGALPAETKIPEPYVLPVATIDTLGGVKPAAKGADMTQEVGVDELGGLWTAPGGGGGEWVINNVSTVTTADEVSVIEFTGLSDYDEAMIISVIPYGKDITAIVSCNGVQIEKDLYQFQHSSSSQICVFHIKRVIDNLYHAEVYYGRDRGRVGKGIHVFGTTHVDARIDSMKISLSAALSPAVGNVKIYYLAR